MLHQEWAMGVDQAIEAEAQAQALCMLTEDFARAYRAFAARSAKAASACARTLTQSPRRARTGASSPSTTPSSIAMPPGRFVGGQILWQASLHGDIRAALTRLKEAGVREMDREKRKKIYFKLQEVLAEVMAAVLLEEV